MVWPFEAPDHMDEHMSKTKKGVYQLTVTDDFAAAHSLRNYGGACENLHGHNFAVEVSVRGEKLDPDVEILMDFKVLKGKLKEVLATLDHVCLNETPFFQENNPSSENLARYIFHELKTLLHDAPATLYSVAVSEKASSKAMYFEE